MREFEELTSNPLWEKIMTHVENYLDRSRAQVVTAAEREPAERVRYLAGQYAGIMGVRDYLRGL